MAVAVRIELAADPAAVPIATVAAPAADLPPPSRSLRRRELPRWRESCRCWPACRSPLDPRCNRRARAPPAVR